MSRHAVVRCAWDSDAAVRYAPDSDVPGLATEAASLEALRQKLPGMIQDLLEDDQSEDIAVDLIAYAHDRVRVGALRPASRRRSRSSFRLRDIASSAVAGAITGSGAMRRPAGRSWSIPASNPAPQPTPC